MSSTVDVAGVRALIPAERFHGMTRPERRLRHGLIVFGWTVGTEIRGEERVVCSLPITPRECVTSGARRGHSIHSGHPTSLYSRPSSVALTAAVIRRVVVRNVHVMHAHWCHVRH